MKMETIRPSSLAKRGTDVDATGVYDWQKQAYQYDNCKSGTYTNSRNGTSSYVGSSTMPMSDDSNADNYND